MGEKIHCDRKIPALTLKSRNVFTHNISKNKQMKYSYKVVRSFSIITLNVRSALECPEHPFDFRLPTKRAKHFHLICLFVWDFTPYQQYFSYF